MGFVLLTKGDFMKNLKEIKGFYLFQIVASVAIALAIVGIFGFKYLTQLHRLSGTHSKMFIQTHNRIDFLEQKIKESGQQHKHETLKPVSL